MIPIHFGVFHTIGYHGNTNETQQQSSLSLEAVFCRGKTLQQNAVLENTLNTVVKLLQPIDTRDSDVSGR